MKQYPKIPGSKHCPLKPCIAFEKYDGSNLRFEYTKKRGWYKFGTRRRLFDHTDAIFAPAIDLFMNTYSDSLSKIIRDHKRFRGIDRVCAFVEFFGKESFAGLHKSDDPTREVMLFDVNVHKFGLLGPRDFIKIFGNLKIARKLYEGKANGSFFEAIRNGKYDVPRSGEWDIFEGAVCKGGSGGTDLWMSKIKTKKFKKKLQEVYANDWENYWE